MRQQGIEPRSTAWKATMLTITPLSLLTSYGQIFNGFLFANFYAPQWQWQALWFNVRMAEWSKAPDSRMWSFHHHSGWGLSGPHMWAWVRIPLLTHLFLTFLYIVYFIKKSHVRQQGIEPRSTAWKATMLTITPLSQLITACQTSNVFLVFQNRLCSHLHTADIPFTYSNHSPVAITKFFESDVGKQKKNRTHLC